MLGSRFLVACVLVTFTTSAFAERWEEVVPEKNLAERKFYFDQDIGRVAKNSIKTQYMIVEKQNQEPIPGGPANRSYNKTVYKATIDCTTYEWVFSGEVFYLDNLVQFSKALPSKKIPAPPKGSAPLLVAEKACALR